MTWTVLLLALAAPAPTPTPEVMVWVNVQTDSLARNQSGIYAGVKVPADHPQVVRLRLTLLKSNGNGAAGDSWTVFLGVTEKKEQFYCTETGPVWLAGSEVKAELQTSVRGDWQWQKVVGTVRIQTRQKDRPKLLTVEKEDYEVDPEDLPNESPPL